MVSSVVRVFTSTVFWKATVPEPSSTRIVSAVTAPVKVALPLSTTRTVPTSVSDVPEMPPAAPASRIRLKASPVTAPTVMVLPVPVSSVVAPSRSTTPSVSVSPVVAIVPMVVVVLAVDVTPPANVMLSATLSPKVTPPVLLKVTALVISLSAPWKTTAYAALVLLTVSVPAVTSPPKVTVSSVSPARSSSCTVVASRVLPN